MSIKPLPISIPASIARPIPVVGADAMLQSAGAGIRGLKDRIAGLDQTVVPASFIGPTPAVVFHPEKESFYYDVFQDGSAPGAGTSQLVNYILRSGTTYQLPVIIGGNGVFLARSFRINIMQRFNMNALYVAARNVAQGVVAPMVNGFSTSFPWTTKFSLFPLQPMVQAAVGTPQAGQSPSINYRWNIQDPVSGFNYCDNLIPASALLDRRYLLIPDAEGSATSTYIFDGDWHEFDAPWRFDKAYQMNILFRPLTDIIQFDSSVDISTNGSLQLLDYDDRTGGLRDQSVTVQVEFQGERVGGK